MMTSLERVQSALAPRYVVRRELGAGGMAVVYLAEDPRYGRPVAVKVLRPELAAALGPERFLREIKIAAGLRHPHILPLYDSGEANGLLYYVMPYVEGESLRDRLRRERQLPVDEALGIAREVADALAHAHEREIIHRDIKPENILLEGGHALVADFGIARAVGSAATTQLTATGLAIGTPAYMSPEQALGDAAVDARSDVYALGCVLYEMLAGEPPYTGPTAQAIMARQLTEPVRSLRTVRETVPDQVEGAVMRALARVPADRFRSATAFRDALLGGQGPPDRPARAEAKAGRRITRRRTLLATAAVAAVTLAGVAIALPRGARLRGGAPPVASAAVPGVAVLPFRTTGADPELWHEGIVDLLSYNLDGIGQLRKIDPVTVLTGWRRMGGSASNALTANDAREVGRRLGSRYVVTGRAVQIGADVQLIAEVQDVESGEMRGAVRVTRPADSASSLVDGLTMELVRSNLLPTDGAYPPPSLSRATTTSLPALKEYLAGERDYRTAQWSDAVRHYRIAIEADSNFASAWFRLSSTCGWGQCSQELAEAYYTRALKLADQLPDRDAKLIRAMSTNNVEALEALTATYPDDVEAWANLGDAYFHHGGVSLRPTDVYRGAFTRAVRLYPYYAEPYEHLIEDAFLRLDSLDAQHLIDGYLGLGGNHACSYQVSHDLVWGTAAVRERAMAVLDTVALIDCVQAPLAAPPHALDRMAQIYAHTADTAGQVNRTVAIWRLLQVRVPNGQITAARQALARLAAGPATDKSLPRWQIQLHLSGFPDSATARRAARVLAAQGAPTDYFWLGALAISEGRWTDVEAVRRALGRQTQSVEVDPSPPGANARAYAAALGAYAGLVRGDRSRLAEFESALARLPVLGWDIEQPHQYLRYRVGKLLFDAGQTRDAERYFRSFNPYEFFSTTQAELYLGRLTEAGGRPEKAAAHYGRFVRWWRYADEPLRPQWEEARQAVSRLAEK
ncbi:MAG: protein kinase domain-containing protein [Gemmatimonadales bacterium]